MGSVGNISSMTASDFNIEEKKWNKRERRNLENATNFMSSQFGDIRDLIGKVLRRSEGELGAAGLMDRNGAQGRGRATYFATGLYASESHIIHEFTHAVTEEIADHYKELGYNSKNEVFSAMRSEVYSNMNKPEPNWDGRKWRDRATEFLSRHMEAYAKDDYTQQNHKVSEETAQTLKTIKKWYKKVRK